MVPVVIESPYGKRVDGATATPDEVERNLRYLAACMKDSLNRGEAPFASHGLYPMALDDKDPAQRALGMNAGFVWGKFAKRHIFYIDLGMTPGMAKGLDLAYSDEKDIEFRSLEEWRA